MTSSNSTDLSVDEITVMIKGIETAVSDFLSLSPQVYFDSDSDEPDYSKDDELNKRTQSDNDFSYDAIMKHITTCAKHHKRLTKADFFRDIVRIVLIGLVRGNIRKDQLARTDPRGAVLIENLAYWYQIRMRSSARERIQLKSDTLTFVRAITCFPHLASNLLYKKAGLAKNGVKSVLASEELPDAMKHSGFSGLIPKGCNAYLMKAYKYAHAAYMVDFGNLINPGNTRSLKEASLRQLNYSNIGIEKSSKSDEFRVGILKKVGLTDSVVFKKIVEVCNNLCKVVDEPELTLETAEKYHIKDNMICFFEDDTNIDVDSGELNVATMNDPSTSNN